MSLHTIILAAGEGSRMKSNRAKALQKVGGSSMLQKICATAGSISPDITLVVGYDKESIIEESKNYSLNISIAEQPMAIGTGDAVKCGLESTISASKILVLYGDVPLIRRETLDNLINSSDSGLSILTTVLDNPFGYGRVKKDASGHALAIVEEKDASESDKEINEIFTGVLCGSKDLIEEGLKEIKNDNAANEYYLTDLVTILSQNGIKIKTYNASNDEVKGANSKQELAQLEAIYRKMNSEELFNQGVTISDKSRLDIRGDVTAGKDCSIDVNVILEGTVTLGDNVSIGPNTIIKDSVIGSNSKIEPFHISIKQLLGTIVLLVLMQGCEWEV